mmetsp:Transcript_16582/g.33968  ORF Transcript_16582/g.33968 Transcript_16582/m.33968 type:complete len:104 (+) Transcript_16582:802-1113(+)
MACISVGSGGLLTQDLIDTAKGGWNNKGKHAQNVGFTVKAHVQWDKMGLVPLTWAWAWKSSKGSIVVLVYIGWVVGQTWRVSHSPWIRANMDNAPRRMYLAIG